MTETAVKRLIKNNENLVLIACPAQDFSAEAKLLRSFTSYFSSMWQTGGLQGALTIKTLTDMLRFATI